MQSSLLFILLFFGIGLSSIQAQQVSQYLNQVVSYPLDEDNPPTQLNLSLNLYPSELLFAAKYVED